jgi:hypothetical protein
VLTAGVCFVAARYWHDRAAIPAPTAPKVVVHSEEGRVPMPPALSTLDPRSLEFRTVKREGLASPSLAWGDYLEGRDDEGVGEKVAALPTNAWYLVRLCSMELLLNCCYVRQNFIWSDVWYMNLSRIGTLN